MRNYLLDYYKILLAVFVVGIHTSPFVEYSKQLSFLFNLGIFRLAVPSFFLINGYYSLKALSSKHELKKYLLRVLKLYIFWMALYFPIYLYTHDFSVKNFIWGFIVLIYGYGHLWYITALMGGIALFFYLLQRYSKRIILILAVSFYFMGCFIELAQGHLSTVNSGLINEILILQVWKLNFIFFAFPFLAIGYYMKKDAHVFNRRDYLLIAFFMFSIELIISYKFLTHGRNMLFSLILIAPLILSILMNLKFSKIKNLHLNKYLEKLPNSIYYVHGLPNFFIALVFVNMNTSYRFIIVSLISLVLGIVLIKLNSRTKVYFKFNII